MTKTDLQVSTCNIALGFLPLGRNSQTIPLRNISSAEVSTSYDLKKIFTGILEILFALILKFLFGGILVEIITVLAIWIGLLNILNSFNTVLCIQRAGNDYWLRVPVTSKGDILRIEKAIKKALDYEADKTDLNTHAKPLAREFANAMAGVLSEEYLRQPAASTESLQEPEAEDEIQLSDRNSFSHFIRGASPFLLVAVVYAGICVINSSVTKQLGKEVAKLNPEVSTDYTERTEENTAADLEEYEIFYFTVLQEYVDAVHHNLDADAAQYVEKTFLNRMEFTSLYSGGSYIFAALIDINNDQVPELFLATPEEGGSGETTYRIIDMYTFYDGQGKKIFDEAMLSGLYEYEICSNGMLRCLVGDKEHILSEVPVEVRYYRLDSAGNIQETESMTSDEEGFEDFEQKYSLYNVQNWNDLNQWENPLSQS